MAVMPLLTTLLPPFSLSNPHTVFRSLMSMFQTGRHFLLPPTAPCRFVTSHPDRRVATPPVLVGPARHDLATGTYIHTALRLACATMCGSRKRRPSSSQDEKEDYMDECTAALVLMSLSCSPHSPNFNVPPPGTKPQTFRTLQRGHTCVFVCLALELEIQTSTRPSVRSSIRSPNPAGRAWLARVSWGDQSPGSDACSWRSSTPSPPLSEGGGVSPSTFWSQLTTDEGIVIDDYDELPRKKKDISRLGGENLALWRLHIARVGNAGLAHASRVAVLLGFYGKGIVTGD
uniref:Uncharacterized protein n=1 Tax=Timema monikensis TaxID=170555 RepID=A0A7R9E6E4_9NEOP|nr:unnamed protein product [Timema monikensis]